MMMTLVLLALNMSRVLSFQHGRVPRGAYRRGGEERGHSYHVHGQQERGEPRAPGPPEDRLRGLQHGTFQHRD